MTTWNVELVLNADECPFITGEFGCNNPRNEKLECEKENCPILSDKIETEKNKWRSL
jgi:hypothetical protein